jgi:hypothetical protein
MRVLLLAEMVGLPTTCRTIGLWQEQLRVDLLAPRTSLGI